jgi:hypothetical protein
MSSRAQRLVFIVGCSLAGVRCSQRQLLMPHTVRSLHRLNGVSMSAHAVAQVLVGGSVAVRVRGSLLPTAVAEMPQICSSYLALLWNVNVARAVVRMPCCVRQLTCLSCDIVPTRRTRAWCCVNALDVPRHSRPLRLCCVVWCYIVSGLSVWTPQPPLQA